MYKWWHDLRGSKKVCFGIVAALVVWSVVADRPWAPGTAERGGPFVAAAAARPHDPLVDDAPFDLADVRPPPAGDPVNHPRNRAQRPRHLLARRERARASTTASDRSTSDDDGDPAVGGDR